MSGTQTVSDQDIAKALALKPQLPKPFKVGVVFKEPESRAFRGPSWHWSDEDKNKFLSLKEQFKGGEHEVSDIFAISDATFPSKSSDPNTSNASDLKALRLAAAKHGADALLVVSGINDLDSYTNSWGWTYIAIVPALFVPATVKDSLFMARAAMWDVRNEYLYLTADSESLKSDTTPAAFTDERGLLDEAKNDALSKLREEISRMMSALATKKAKSGQTKPLR